MPAARQTIGYIISLHLSRTAAWSLWLRFSGTALSHCFSSSPGAAEEMRALCRGGVPRPKAGKRRDAASTGLECRQCGNRRGRDIADPSLPAGLGQGAQPSVRFRPKPTGPSGASYAQPGTPFITLSAPRADAHGMQPGPGWWSHNPVVGPGSHDPVLSSRSPGGRRNRTDLEGKVLKWGFLEL